MAEMMAGCKISRTTAQKAIDALLQEGQIHKTGLGKRNNPFRFWASCDVVD
jgi:hypothetical protein